MRVATGSFPRSAKNVFGGGVRGAAASVPPRGCGALAGAAPRAPPASTPDSAPRPAVASAPRPRPAAFVPRPAPSAFAPRPAGVGLGVPGGRNVAPFTYRPSSTPFFEKYPVDGYENSP